MCDICDAQGTRWVLCRTCGREMPYSEGINPWLLGGLEWHGTGDPAFCVECNPAGWVDVEVITEGGPQTRRILG